jgi:hypothetical protein
MASRTRYRGAALLILAAGFGLAPALQANAQAVPGQENTEAAAAEADAAVDINDVDMTDVDIKNLDWSQLNVDASTLTSPASKARAAPRAGSGADMSWSSQDRPDGSAALTVKQALSPFWDARVGADMTVVHQPQTLTSADLLRQKLSIDGQPSQSSGSAWAAITAPGVASIWDKTAIEARVDPSQDQSKLGTSLSKSLPLSEQYSLTLQNGYNVIQQGLAPVPGISGHATRNYEVDRSAKLSIADTGTSLIAGESLSSTDDKWLRRIGAEQKLFGGVTLNGSIGETALGASNKSLTAGFKRSW